MKNILFISDVFLDGGLETRIIEQISILKKHKVKPFLLCNKLNNHYLKCFKVASDSLSLEPSTKTLSTQKTLNDVETICRFCAEHNIDFIDCQPFWCALPAAIAANKLNIPISFTIHGIASANFISDDHLPGQSLYNVIFSYGFSQIFATAEYLTELYSYLPNIIILRNGLPLNRLESQSFKNTKKVAIASRLDEPKTKLILDFLPTLYESKAINQIDIYGKGDRFDQLESFVSQNKMTDKVKLCGWTNNFPNSLSKNDYMLAFGMGRVVLETIKSGVPAGILGYGGFAGLVNRDNLLNFSKTNLTSWQQSPKGFAVELKQLFKNPANYFFKATQLSLFNVNLIWQQYYDIIQKLSNKNSSSIQEVYSWLLQHPTSNIFKNQELQQMCINSLSNGGHPISSQLFRNIIKSQSSQINNCLHQINILTNEMNALKSLNAQLQYETSLSLKEIAKKRLKRRFND